MIINEGIVPVLVSVWAGITLVILGTRGIGWSIVAVGLLLVVLARNPPRFDESGEDLVVAPADGRVKRVNAILPSDEAENPSIEIEIENGLFDVHVTRAPISGTSRILPRTSRRTSPGTAHSTTAPQRIEVVWEECGPTILSQRAHMLRTRTIDSLDGTLETRKGSRIGLTPPGGTVKMTLPLWAEVTTTVGQHVRAGETVVARFPTRIAR